MRVVIPNSGLQLIWIPAFWLQVIFHKNLGERFLITDNYVPLTVGLALPVLFWAEPELNDIVPLGFYFSVFLAIRILFELGRLGVNKQKRTEPHGYSMGEVLDIPWGYIMPNKKIVSRLIEPLIAILIGLILVSTSTDEILGYFLIISGATMFHKYHVLNRQIRLHKKDIDDRKCNVF